MRNLPVLLAISLISCRAEPPAAENVLAADQAANNLATPAGPGTAGGLPDNRTPVSEGPIDAKGAEGAAQVLQHYFALAEQRRFAEAYRLWSDGGRATGESEADFVASFEQYREIHGQIGAPGQQEGAAGSSYVAVPVQLYGRTADGKPFRASGTMTLRRVNDVPGATAEQLQWRIYKSELKPAG